MRSATTRSNPAWYDNRPNYTPTTLGINYYNMNLHDGTNPITWLQSYDATKADNDLALLQTSGITKIRVFAPLESIMSYASSVFTMNSTYRDNLKDFLTKANSHGISCILVMSRGETPSAPSSLDGYTRWELVLTSNGRTAYKNAMVAYVSAVDTFSNILMYELCNEPYSCAAGFSAYAVTESVTQQNVLDWLTLCYGALKSTTAKPVGISEYEEEEQATYQYFSDATKRTTYIDPVTDIYSMHVYRPDNTYMADFRQLTSKPKWLSEVGHLNYSDPTASSHPIAGNDELFNALYDPQAVRSITRKALNAGFSLVMPWSFADNANVVVSHNGDGTHTPKEVLLWMQATLTGRTQVGSRSVS